MLNSAYNFVLSINGEKTLLQFASSQPFFQENVIGSRTAAEYREHILQRKASNDKRLSMCTSQIYLNMEKAKELPAWHSSR